MGYAQRHTWRGNSDNDLYKICRGSADIRTGWGGWKNTQPRVRRDMVGIPESEKINAYALSTYICNQLSTNLYHIKIYYYMGGCIPVIIIMLIPLLLIIQLQL